MSHKCLRPLAVFATIVYLNNPGHAQSPDILLVKGELRCESPVNFREYRIDLEDLNHRTQSRQADVNSDGSFEFHHIPPGDFTLRVTTLHGDSIQEEFVTVNSQAAHLSVRLAAAKKLSLPGTVSLTQLRHPPDRKAVQAFAAAQRFAESGHPERAAEELEKAVRISPEFAGAYTNLAVQHIRMRHFQEAVDEMTRAIEIAGPSPLMLCNLAFAQIGVGHTEESLRSVRAALRLNAGYPQAHLILGTILGADPRTREEAIRHLERAAESIPSARPALEQLQAAR